MISRLRYRLAAPEDTSRIVSLLNTAFRVPVHAETWDWYSCGNPFGTTRVYLAADEQEQVVGAFAFTPAPLHIGGAPVQASSGHHLMLQPSYRGGGPFVALSRAALAGEAEHGMRLALGLPNRKSHEPQKILMKWSDFCFLDCLYQENPAGTPHTCRELSAFPEEFDSFYSEITRPLDFYIDKSAAWMNWRFCKRPGQPYTTYACGADALSGYVVLKRWQEADGSRKAHMIDLHAQDDHALANLLAAAGTYAAGCTELNLWAAPGYPYRQFLESRGFRPRETARQPLIARALDGSTLAFPPGPGSFSYADGDFVF